MAIKIAQFHGGPCDGHEHGSEDPARPRRAPGCEPFPDEDVETGEYVFAGTGVETRAGQNVDLVIYNWQGDTDPPKPYAVKLVEDLLPGELVWGEGVWREIRRIDIEENPRAVSVFLEGEKKPLRIKLSAPVAYRSG
jgi:hypothetical protein